MRVSRTHTQLWGNQNTAAALDPLPVTPLLPVTVVLQRRKVSVITPIRGEIKKAGSYPRPASTVEELFATAVTESGAE